MVPRNHPTGQGDLRACPQPGSGLRVHGEEDEGGEERSLKGTFLHGGATKKDGEPTDYDRYGEQDHLRSPQAEFEGPFEPDRDDPIAGMVSPMLAMADPKARLRLVCTPPLRALRRAVSVSAASTSNAITTPTAVGVPRRPQPRVRSPGTRP